MQFRSLPTRYPFLLLKAVFIFGLFALQSCQSKNEEEVWPQMPCDTMNVSYKNTIVPILSQNCYSCHSEATNQQLASGNNLEGHDKIIAGNYVIPGKAAESRMYKSVAHIPPAPFMPQNGVKLPQCDINKIKAWINQGAQNN